MRDSLSHQRLVAVFLVAVLLFVSPVTTLFDRGAVLFGVPVLYLYLFTAWAAVIVAITWVVERRSG
jgi:uncharacterized membrane protein